MLKRSRGRPIVISAEALGSGQDIPMDKLADPKPLEPPEASPGVASISPTGDAPRGAAEEHRRAAPGTYLPWVLVLYGAAFLCPGGADNFALAFMYLLQFQLPDFLLGRFWYSLIAASWLANPALWLATVFLAVRAWRLAKWAGFVALLLGFLAVWPGVAMVAYWLWIGSMILFVIAAYGCGRDAASTRLRKPRPVDPDL
jgi:hypothetical protein